MIHVKYADLLCTLFYLLIIGIINFFLKLISCSLAKKWNTTVGFYTDWCAHPDMGQSSPSPPDLFIYGGGSYLDANTK